MADQSASYPDASDCERTAPTWPLPPCRHQSDTARPLHDAPWLPPDSPHSPHLHQFHSPAAVLPYSYRVGHPLQSPPGTSSEADPAVATDSPRQSDTESQARRHGRQTADDSHMPQSLPSDLHSAAATPTCIGYTLHHLQIQADHRPNPSRSWSAVQDPRGILAVSRHRERCEGERSV